MIGFGFRTMLVLATAILVGYCVDRYLQNQNTASIDYKRYHQTEKDIYPSISICFGGLAIYDSNRLEQTYGINNSAEYSMFLKGEKWNDEMVMVDYDHVTDHLKSYFHGLFLSSDVEGKKLLYQWINMNEKTDGYFEPFPFLISKRTAFQKCFTFDFSVSKIPNISGQIIRMFKVSFNITKRPDFSLSFGMHYPGQMSRNIPLEQEMDKNMGTFSGKIDAMLFKIGVLEILRRREDSKSSCNPESNRTDEYLDQEMAELIHCKPSHWVNVSYPRICNNSDSMKKANYADEVFVDAGIKSLKLPCDELEDVAFNINTFHRGTFDNSRYLKVNSNSANLMFIFTSTVYREIVHIRSYDFEGMIGNGGGYVGLFLGFAIWQLPDFIIFIFQVLSNSCLK